MLGSAPHELSWVARASPTPVWDLTSGPAPCLSRLPQVGSLWSGFRLPVKSSAHRRSESGKERLSSQHLPSGQVHPVLNGRVFQETEYGYHCPPVMIPCSLEMGPRLPRRSTVSPGPIWALVMAACQSLVSLLSDCPYLLCSSLGPRGLCRGWVTTRQPGRREEGRWGEWPVSSASPALPPSQGGPGSRPQNGG